MNYRLFLSLFFIFLVYGCASRKYSAGFQHVNQQSQKHNFKKGVLTSETEEPVNYKWEEEDSLSNPAGTFQPISSPSSSRKHYENQYQRIDSLHAIKQKGQELQLNNKSPKRAKSNQKRKFWPLLAGGLLLVGMLIAMFGLLPTIGGVMFVAGLSIGFGYLIQQAVSKGGKSRWLNVLGTSIAILLLVGIGLLYYALLE